MMTTVTVSYILCSKLDFRISVVVYFATDYQCARFASHQITKFVFASNERSSECFSLDEIDLYSAGYLLMTNHAHDRMFHAISIDRNFCTQSMRKSRVRHFKQRAAITIIFATISLLIHQLKRVHHIIRFKFRIFGDAVSSIFIRRLLNWCAPPIADQGLGEAKI